MNHIALYLSNISNKEEIIDLIFENNFLKKLIDLSGLQGELFSQVTINKLMEEEFRHDHFVVSSSENAGLSTMSSGQQRKALMNYILSKKPGFIVIDDIFGSIDEENRNFIIDALTQYAHSAIIIQLFYRKQDVLGFINTVITLNEGNEIIAQQPANEFISASFDTHHLHSFTLPHLFYNNIFDINPLVQLNHVSASYGEKQVLKDICWTIQQGEFWQLKGPNGSGKSTLISMVTGDNPKGYGQDIVLFGRKKGSGETIWEIKKQIGYFTPHMLTRFAHNDTVENMIISGLVDSIGLYTKPTDLQRNIAKAWVEVLGPLFRNKAFRALTFGQQRIVMVARAMVKQPPLLILDEPTVGLDDENTSVFMGLIQAIASQQKIAIIYVSHREEAELKPGKVFELIPTSEGSIGMFDPGWGQMFLES